MSGFFFQKGTQPMLIAITSILSATLGWWASSYIHHSEREVLEQELHDAINSHADTHQKLRGAS